MPAVPTTADRDADLWSEHPRIGVGIIMHYPNWGIPWLFRKGTSHGNGQWSLPGGRLEYNETLLMCAIRELHEEFGITPTAIRRIEFISEDFFPDESMHWITHYFLGKASEMPRLMEPDKADDLLFTNLRPPEPTFAGAAQAIEWLNDNKAWGL